MTATVESLFSIILLIPTIYRLAMKLKNNKLKGIVLPPSTGKTFLSSNFNVDKYTTLLDIETSTRLSLSEIELKQLDQLRDSGQISSYNSMFYIKCKEYLKNQKKAFKRNVFIVISSDRSLLKFIGINPSNILVFSPTNEFFEKICVNLDETKKSVATSARQNLLLETRKENLNVFNSFQELSNILGQKLGLTHNI